MLSLTPHAPISLAQSFFNRHINREHFTRRLSLALLLLTACILPLATIAALADGGTTTLVSVNSAGTAGGGFISSFAANNVDIEVTLQHSSNPVILGTNLTYEISISNNDSSNSFNNLTLVDALPAGMTYVSATSDSASTACSESAGTVTCQIAEIKRDSIIYISITVTPTTVGTFTNTVTLIRDINGDPPDITASVTTSVLPADACLSFSTLTGFSVGNYPGSIVIGDFNHDGNLDAATSNNSGPASISVLLGNGTGGFSPSVNYAVGGNPAWLTTGDFNADGNLDFAVLTSFPRKVSILLGNGAGDFGTATEFATGARPESIAAGDFNNDGSSDLAVTNFDSNIISILLSDGAGNFASPSNVALGGNPAALVISDFNSDGNADLAVPQYSSNIVSVLLGNGIGGFAASTGFSVGTPYRIVPADFNDDGKTDLAVLHSTPNNSLSVFLDDGTGGFSSTPSFSISGDISIQAAADFNGDGKTDILGTFGSQPDNILILSGDGAGDFGAAQYFSPNPLGTATFVLAGDFNNDSRSDLIVTDNGNKVGVLLNMSSCGGTPTTAPVVSINPNNLNFGTQPLNTTSQPQVVTVTNTGDAPLHVSNVETTGADANDFAVASNTCTAAIAPNATCIIGVTFTPSATDARIAFLTLTDDAEGSPHSVLLEGGGSDPQASFSATSVDFGNQVAGASAHFYRPSQDIIITNAGAGDLVITNITLSGADASEFSFTSDALPVTIPANSSTIVKARFAPTTPDFRYATLTFEDNAFDSPQTVDLYGTGVMAANLAFGRGIDVNGNGERQNRWTPVQISGLSDVAAFAGNEQHTLALRTDGTVWAWGENSIGQLGDGTTTYRPTPVQVSGLSDVQEIAAGSLHSLALKSDGTVWAWGANGQNGQLGDGTTTNRATPVQVSGLANVVAISTKNNHNLALKSDGTVWAWGNNDSGQLGDGTITLRRTPVQVNNLSGVVAISASWDAHSMAAKADGSVWAWGYNSGGELGSGIPVESSSSLPVQVAGLNDVIAVALGQNHTLALKSDGTIWTLGSNGEGQLGMFPPVQTITPIQVTDLTGVKAISAGLSHNLVLKSDGTVWAWGWNISGELGIAEFDFASYTPVQTLGIGSGVFIEASYMSSFAVAASPVVTLDSSGLDFGRQIINTASAEQTVTVTNDGFAPLIINQNSGLIEGESRGDFTITANTCSTDVNPGDSCAISIAFAPVSAGDKNANLVLYDNAFDSAQVIPLTGTGSEPIDLRLEIGADPSPAHHGRNLTYYLRAINNGSSAATNVTLTDRLPTGLTFVSATPSQGTCSFASGTVTCDLESLAVGADAYVLLVVIPTRIGNVTNTASVTALQVDTNPANNSATETTEVVAVADIYVGMTASPDPVLVGGTLTYRIVVENYGIDAATGVTLTDTISAGTSFVSVRSTRGTCSGTTTVTCNIGTLANNATATVTLVVRPNVAGFTSNTATATANEYDPEPINEAGSGATVNAVADLAVTMTDAPDPVPLGSNVTYTIVVRNYGASPATGVVLSDTLPAGLTFVSAASTQGTCVKTSTVNCTIGNLANNQTATVTLVATAAAAGTLTNTASVSGAETDPNTSNNLNRQSTRVTTLVSLTLTPSTVTGACQTSTGKVTLSSPAPTGGAVVTLASLSAAAIIPSSVIVPGGLSSQTFIITTQSVAAAQTATIRATLGATIKTATLTLKPLTVQAMTLTPNPARGGTTIAGTVTLTCAATSATTVTLSSSNTSVARPTSSSVVVAAGATTASFQVTTTATTTTRTTFINARAGGITKSLSLTVTP
ncbi:MAG: choice-of-anchor D domain-containing protein [Pyrinomonadaceae bacterium MAG19_C2-C3]|nr:choice-of-anchor D domain-containing protein [Pyrinomonadaceae bacterium MAG19_C2-C3]